MAGALIQTLTRNPLADPGLLGVNAGAAASIVTLALVTGALPAHLFWAALLARWRPSAAVYWLGAGGRGLMPVRLILAGAALNAVLYAYVQAVALLRSDIFDVYRGPWARWPAIPGPPPPARRALCRRRPAAGPGAGAAAEPAGAGRRHGARPGLSAGRHRLAGLLRMQAVAAAAATAACGPIAFVGLAVPHLARRLAGPDLRWQLAFCLLLGPVLMLAADILARSRAPAELLTGVVVALHRRARFLLAALRRDQRERLDEHASRPRRLRRNARASRPRRADPRAGRWLAVPMPRALAYGAALILDAAVGRAGADAGRARPVLA